MTLWQKLKSWVRGRRPRRKRCSCGHDWKKHLKRGCSVKAEGKVPCWCNQPGRPK